MKTLVVFSAFIFCHLHTSTGHTSDKSCSSKDSGESSSMSSKYQIPEKITLGNVIKELTEGENGFFVLPNMFSKQDMDQARSLINQILDKQYKYKESTEGKGKLRTKIWNLVNKGEIFRKIVQHPILMQIASATLGEDFHLGSISSNTIFPGDEGQEPHLDYPYWDLFRPDIWPFNPKVEESRFFLSLKATVMVDDFTQENGATAVRPGSQRTAVYPWDMEEFRRHQTQVTGKSGDVLVFFGNLQHCAMPNLGSNLPRSGIILQFLPKFVRPMEDLKNSLDFEVVNNLSPLLRRVIGLDYHYPAVLDDEKLSFEEKGRKKFDI